MRFPLQSQNHQRHHPRHSPAVDGKIFAQILFTPGTKAHISTGSLDFGVQSSSATVADAEPNIEVSAGHVSFHHPFAIAEIIHLLKLSPAG